MSLIFQVEQIVSEYQTAKKQFQYQKHQLSHPSPKGHHGDTPNHGGMITSPNNISNNELLSSSGPTPHHHQFLMQQILPLVKTNQTSLLYSLSHKLIQLFPEDENAFFCIGCYYWTVEKLEQAQRFLRRAVKVNRDFAEAWILLGHIYSTLEETEQALAAYRTAIRLLPKHKLPLICLSKELLRNNNHWLAAHMLQSAIAIDPSDLLIMNEMALIAVKMGNLSHGEQILRKAIHNLRQNSNEDAASTCEIVYNYATVLRKLGRYEVAIQWYQRCLNMAWHQVWALVGIGFTLHLLRRFEEAATYYHQALALQPNCVICSEMLNHLMEDMLKYNSEEEEKAVTTTTDQKEKN